MSPLPRCLVAALIALALPSCATGISNGEPVDLAERLAEASDFRISPELSALSVDSVAPLRKEDAIRRVDIEIQSGTAVMEADADGSLVLEELVLDLNDQIISPENQTTQIVLTDIRVELESPARGMATWSEDGGSAEGELQADFLIHWSVVGSEGPVSFPPQHLRGLPLLVDVWNMPPNKVEVSFSTEHLGEVWEIPNVVELNNLEVVLGGELTHTVD